MDENETIDDIAEKIRQDGWEISGLLIPDDGGKTRAMLPGLADRIKAAWNREQIGRDTLSDGRSVTVAVAEQRNRLARLDAEYAGVLNMAKVRGLLSEIERMAYEAESDNDEFRLHQLAINIGTAARAALAAPARNCDVGTAEEQAARLRQYCLDKDSLDCRHYCMQSPKAFDCSMEWAQAKYEKEEGGAE